MAADAGSSAVGGLDFAAGRRYRLNSFVNILVGLFVVGYFGATLVVLFRKYSSTAPAQRVGSGLGLVVWGAVVALGPLLIASIMNHPDRVLPGRVEGIGHPAGRCLTRAGRAPLR